MAKKITLTVNESLSRKIDEWRSSFNLSRLFQDAVTEAIKRKEEFQRMLSGKGDIPQIVERLKAEKRGWLEKARAEGEEDGTSWAGRAHYEELTAAVAASSAASAASAEGAPPSDAERRAAEAWEERRGPVGTDEKEKDDARAAYRRGWRTGVCGLWDLVKDQLDDE